MRIVAGFAAGGGVDITARLIGQWLDRAARAILRHREPAGAGGNIGTEAVVTAPPDGYTLLLATVPNAVNASLYPKLNFNFIRDIAPVAGIIRVPMIVMVHPSVPAKTRSRVHRLCPANPGKVNMASAGNGSAPHMAGELFKMMAGVDHGACALSRPGAGADGSAGRRRCRCCSPPRPAPSTTSQTGKLRALAVTTATRAEVLPELPPVADFVPGYETSQWYGMCAPAKTPPEIIEKLNSEINAAIADPAMKARLAALGGEPLPGPPPAFGKLIADDTEKWARVVRAAGLKPQ